MKPLEGVEHGNILPTQLKLESSLEPDKKLFHSGPEIPLWSSHKCPLMCMLLTEEKSSLFKSSMYHTEHLPNVGSSVRADLVCTTPNHVRYQQYFPPNSLHSNDRKHMNPDSVNMLVFLPDNLSNHCWYILLLLHVSWNSVNYTVVYSENKMKEHSWWFPIGMVV